MGTKSLHVDLGFGSSGPAGPLTPEESVISLNGGHASVRVDRVLGVVEGPAELVPEVRLALESAFSKGSAADAMIPGDEPSYVSRILRQIVAPTPDKGDVAVAIALQIGSEVILASTAGAKADVLRATGEFAQFQGRKDEAEQDVKIWRTRLGSLDTIVLGGREVQSHVDGNELRQTVQASFSLEDAADWLVTLAAGRSGHATTALVARVEQHKSQTAVVPSVPTVPRSHSPSLRAVRFVSVGGVAVAALIVAIVLVPGLVKSSGSSASQLRSPSDLGVQPQSGQTLLSWVNMSPGAGGYILRLGHKLYRSSVPNFEIPNSSLTPGKSYTWKVRSLYGNQKSAWSASHSLVAPPRPALRPAKIVGPQEGASLASSKNSLRFCWTPQPSATAFNLFVGGNGKHFVSSRTRSSFKHPAANGTVCVTQVLPVGVSYSWRLGSITTGHVQAWTKWYHFSIATPVTPTAVPTPAETGAYTSNPPGTSGGTTSTTNQTQPSSTQSQSPGTTYQAPSTTSSSSSTSTSNPTVPAPAPTSPVQSCSTPPNC